MSDLVIGIDVGSQGTVAQLIGADGELVAAENATYAVSYPAAGLAEQDPRLWLDAIAGTVGALARHVEPGRIAAVSFGSQLDGLVCVGRDGEPLRDALIWMDRRADRVCDAIATRIDPDELYARGGCNLDGGHVGAKIVWVREYEPDVYAAAARFVLPGSFVAWRASGVPAVDASNASSSMLVDVRRRDWHTGLCDAFGIDPETLAPVVEPHAVLGTVAPWLVDAGLDPRTLVVCGCGDEMAATLGAGVIDPGDVCDVLGTAEPVCAVTPEPRFDATRVVECHPHADPDSWLLENPGWVSGGAYRWFRDEFGASERERAERDAGDPYELLNALAEQAPAASDGLLFLPALMGAMAPEWNADARGVWFGLTPAHTRAHLLRALLEGSAYAFRDCLEAMRGAGLDPQRIVCVAGGARSARVRQMRADVCELPVGVAADVETTARGAAMLAATGGGLYPTVADACRAMRRAGGAELQPDVAAIAPYAASYARYRELYAALRPLFRPHP